MKNAWRRGSKSLAPHSLLSVHIKFLNDSGCVLNDLGIVVGSLLREGVNYVSDSHLFEFHSALLVDAEISDGE